MRVPTVKSSAPGFSLVEVMVALVVICIGMLGIAKLNALMLSNTSTSRVRALVAQETASLADSMHADRDLWDSASGDWTPGTAPLSIAATETAGTTAFTVSGSTTLSTAVGAPPNCTKGGANAPCTAVNMAAYDLSNWAKALSQVLQNSTSNIDCASTTGIITCTINVQWQENTVAANSQEASTGGTAFQTQNYQLVIQP